MASLILLLKEITQLFGREKFKIWQKCFPGGLYCLGSFVQCKIWSTFATDLWRVHWKV